MENPYKHELIIEKHLKEIKSILLAVMACVVIQTTWFLCEKVLDPAAAIAATAYAVRPVDIVAIGGKPVGSHYAPAIKVGLE